MKSQEPDGITTQRVLYFVCHLSHCGQFETENGQRILHLSAPESDQTASGRPILFSTN